jgi:hypothetical protein
VLTIAKLEEAIKGSDTSACSNAASSPKSCGPSRASNGFLWLPSQQPYAFDRSDCSDEVHRGPLDEAGGEMFWPVPGLYLTQAVLDLDGLFTYCDMTTTPD